MPARWTNNGGTLPASPPTARRATISPESSAAPSSPRTPARTMPAPSEVHPSSSSGVAPPPLVASLVEAEALLRRAVDDAQEQAATATAAAAAATAAASRASEAAASAAEEVAGAEEVAVAVAGVTEAVEAAARACKSHAARAEHAAERVEAAAAAFAGGEAEVEAEAEAEEEAAALAPARRLLRAATPLADAASAAALRTPVPLLQIKGPKPSRARKSVAMHVAVPEGPVKLKPRDASVSVEGSRWLLHAVHRPCAYHHRAHTMRTPCAPFCQAAAAYRAQAEAGAASGGRERTARGAAAAPRPVAGAVAALGHRDHIWQ